MPALSTVGHHQIADAATMQYTALNASENAAIEQWWLGRATRPERHIAQSVFAQCKSGRLWLACHCIGDQYPLMHIFERDKTLFLRRMQDRPLHNESCVYFREHSGSAEGGATKAGTTEPHNLRPAEPPAFYSGKAEIGNTRPVHSISSGTPRMNHKRPESSMAQRLRWLLDAAGANVFPQDQNVVRRLIEVAQRTPVKQHTLDRYMFFTPRAVEQGMLADAARRAAHDGLQEHAFLVACVTDIEPGNTMLLEYKGASLRLPEPNKLRVYGSDRTAAAGMTPYVALLMFNRNRDIIDAHLHPIYKPEYFCLVDSGEERKVLAELLAVAVRLREQGIHSRVMKPLYALTRSGILPDFHIALRRDADIEGKHEIEIVIEVLGFSNEDYRLKKQMQANELATMYRYIAYDTRLPYAARGSLSAAVSAIAAELT